MADGDNGIPFEGPASAMLPRVRLMDDRGFRVSFGIEQKYKGECCFPCCCFKEHYSNYAIGSACNDEEAPYEKFWSRLSPQQQNCARMLGYNQEMWDMGYSSAQAEVDWAELSEQQRRAATTLGWDEESWDEEDDHSRATARVVFDGKGQGHLADRYNMFMVPCGYDHLDEMHDKGTHGKPSIAVGTPVILSNHEKFLDDPDWIRASSWVLTEEGLLATASDLDLVLGGADRPSSARGELLLVLVHKHDTVHRLTFKERDAEEKREDDKASGDKANINVNNNANNNTNNNVNNNVNNNANNNNANNSSTSNNTNVVAPTIINNIDMPTLLQPMQQMMLMQQQMVQPAAQQLGLPTNTSTGQPEGLAKLMTECGLSQHLSQAQRWCSQNGCIKICEIGENLDEFVKSLDLKPLEAKRLSNAFVERKQ